MFPRSLLPVSFALLVCSLQPAAASSYRVRGAVDVVDFNPNGRSTEGFFDETNPAQISRAIMYDFQYPSGAGRQVGNVFADAGNGAARLSGNAEYRRDTPFGGAGERRIEAGATATIVIDDLIITGPTNVFTTLRLQLSGTQGAGTTFSAASPDLYARSQVNLSAVVGSTTIGDGWYEVRSTGGSAPITEGFGWLESFTGNNVITSGSFLAQVNTPFQLRISFSMAMTTGMPDSNSGISTAAFDFSHTMSFATDGPVFSLPAGYTANSVSAGIVNNRYVMVPEPSTIALAMVGALAVLLRVIWAKRPLITFRIARR